MVKYYPRSGLNTDFPAPLLRDSDSVKPGVGVKKSSLMYISDADWLSAAWII